VTDRAAGSGSWPGDAPGGPDQRDDDTPPIEPPPRPYHPAGGSGQAPVGPGQAAHGATVPVPESGWGQQTGASPPRVPAGQAGPVGGAGLPAYSEPSAGPVGGGGLPAYPRQSWRPAVGVPGPGGVSGAGAVVAPPPADGRWRTRSVDRIPGTDFGLVTLDVGAVTSGLAVGSLVAGLAGILGAVAVLCFGGVGARDGWGAWVAGAFAIVAGAFGLAGVGLGFGALRQIRRSGVAGRIRFTGRGLALGGISCGGVGVGLTVLGLVLAIGLQLS
jgi:hypothetical protein